MHVRGHPRAAEAELGMPLERAYASFDPTPLAAASLGQAHRVRLSAVDAADTGLDEGVVKIQRPGIEAIVDVDLRALRRVAGWLSRVRIVADHVDLPALVEEFAHVSHQEIDYIQEARQRGAVRRELRRRSAGWMLPRWCGSARRGAC